MVIQMIIIINIGNLMEFIDHFDALGKLLARAGFQGCDYFLCHNARLFDFTV